MALITGLVLLLFGGLGIASSPIVVGHPVLLSPERLALKTYLDAATVGSNASPRSISNSR